MTRSILVNQLFPDEKDDVGKVAAGADSVAAGPEGGRAAVVKV